MKKVDVDVVGLKPLQGLFHTLNDGGVRPVLNSFDSVPPLGAQKKILPSPGKMPPDSFFRKSITPSRINKIHTAVNGPIQKSPCGVLVHGRRPYVAGSKAQKADLKSGISQFSVLHTPSLTLLSPFVFSALSSRRIYVIPSSSTKEGGVSFSGHYFNNLHVSLYMGHFKATSKFLFGHTLSF
jgi:hypothetical protein